MNKSIADWRASQLYSAFNTTNILINEDESHDWIASSIALKPFPWQAARQIRKKQKREKRKKKWRSAVSSSFQSSSSFFCKKNTKISIWYQYILEEYRAASYASWNYEYIFVRERSNRVEDEESETWRKYETMLGNNDVMLRQVLSTVIFLLCEMTSRPRTRRAFSCAPRCVPPRPA